jgi:hypothetical protein
MDVESSTYHGQCSMIQERLYPLMKFVDVLQIAGCFLVVHQSDSVRPETNCRGPR